MFFEKISVIEILHSFVLGILGYSVSSFLHMDYVFQSIFFVLFVLLYFIAKHYCKKIIYEENVRKIEESLPDFFLELSLYKNANIVCSIRNVLQNHIDADNCENKKDVFFQTNNDLLYVELTQVISRIDSKISFNDSLNYIKQKYKTEKIVEAVSVLEHFYSSGSSFNSMFRDVAINSKKKQTLIQERSVSTLIEKYTIVAAAIFFVPALIGISVQLSDSFDIGSITDFGIIENNASNLKSLKQTAKTAVGIYIFEFAILTAFFVSMQANKLHFALIYSFLFCTISYLVFSNIHVLLT